MSKSSSTPVLIVGAGPAGLVLALTLRQNDIPVRIIEKEPRTWVGQRGAGIMPRTRELYQLMGILPDVEAKALPLIPMVVYRLPGGTEPAKKFDLEWPPMSATPSTPYTELRMLGQNATEAILMSHLAKHGCEVELGTELQSLEQFPDRVIARVYKQGANSETIQCRWLIGADGAKGVVRKQMGLKFLGETMGYLSEHLVIGDIQVENLDNKLWHSWGDLSTIMVTLRGTEDDDIFFLFLGGKIDHAKVVASREELLRVIRLGTGRDDLKIGKVKSLAEYRPQARMVERFGIRRAFVVGDAAHVHTPFGAQGLNSSVQDSANLAWKLALVEKGIAQPSILDTYTEERLPIIAEMLKTSDRLYGKFTEVKADGSESEETWQRGGLLNQLGVNIRWSSIVLDERTLREERPVDPYGATRKQGDIVRAGERAPDAPGLLPVGRESRGKEATSLFRIFRTHYHTVLIFSPDPAKFDTQPIIQTLRRYPAYLLRVAVIHPHDAPSDLHDNGADIVLMDREGHAYSGYAASKGQLMVAIVRPDGVVGGIVFGVEGVQQYFGRVFSNLNVSQSAGYRIERPRL